MFDCFPQRDIVDSSSPYNRCICEHRPYYHGVQPVYYFRGISPNLTRTTSYLV